MIPDLKIGDEILGGKFRNKLYIIKSFSKDDNNQPVIVTKSGKTVKMFSFRIKKLMPVKENSIKLISMVPINEQKS